MMKLSSMRLIEESVDGDGNNLIAAQSLAAWPHDPGSVRFVRSSATAVFAFSHGAQRFMLRVVPAADRDPLDLQSQVEFLEYLATHGVAVSRPVASTSGQLVEQIDVSGRRYYASVVEQIDGAQREFGALTPEQFGAWGRALGKLHQSARAYKPSHCPTWGDQLGFAAECIPHREEAAWKVINQVSRRLRTLPRRASSYGLIHGDFELDNLIWSDGTISAIDFDDFAQSWFVADIAYALRDLFGDSTANVNLDDPSLRAFVDGYREHHRVSDHDLKMLPVFVRLHNVVMFARLLRAIERRESADEPEWLAGVRRRLVAKLAFYRAEFARAEV